MYKYFKPPFMFKLLVNTENSVFVFSKVLYSVVAQQLTRNRSSEFHPYSVGAQFGPSIDQHPEE